MTNNVLKTGLILVALTASATASFAQQADTGQRGRRDGTQTTGTRPTTQNPGTPRTQPVVTTPAPAPRTPATSPVVVAPQPTPYTVQPRWSLGGNTPGIDRRQAEQAREIERGQRNGSLTAREVSDLKAEQARIADLERRAKADGVVTHQERQQIRNAQSAAGRHIAAEESDNERTGGQHRRHGGWGWRGWW